MNAREGDSNPSPGSASLGFPSKAVLPAVAGPGALSPAFDESLLHFCCTDSEEKSTPPKNAALVPPSGGAPQKGSRERFYRQPAARGLPISTPPLLSVREVARQLRVSTATLYRLCERGELRHVRVSNAIRIAPAHIEGFLHRNCVGPANGPDVVLFI